MTQEEITAWEKQRSKAISGFEIHYGWVEGWDYDEIVFVFYNKQKVTLKRDHEPV